jgi:hypothetical protein
MTEIAKLERELFKNIESLNKSDKKDPLFFKLTAENKILQDKIASLKSLEAQKNRNNMFEGSLMERLEREGMDKVAAAQKKEGIIPSKETLTNILQAGFDEFKKETGRNMSYGEMRDLYG